MQSLKRVFIFGAGFSKPAGMPLATEILPMLLEKLKLDEMHDWLDGMRERLAWLSGNGKGEEPFGLNIEQVFHYAHFDAEVHRLRQHLATMGRDDGPETSWNHAESISTWLSYLVDTLRDVIFECDMRSDLEPIKRWANSVTDHDAVLTFDYDTLVERSLTDVKKTCNHGTGREGDEGISVFKLHGSIDWIVADRSETFSKLDLLFEKKNANRAESKTGHVEDDCRLWRCRTLDQLKNWIEGRDLQLLSHNALPRTVGIAGLGAYKELHQIPGLGCVWARGMRALYDADVAIMVGFSMSDFDAMAQMQFAEIARARSRESKPLRVTIIDPFLDDAGKERFRRVFRTVEFIEAQHEDFDWQALN